MPENNGKKTVNVSTLIIIVVAIIIVLVVIFAAILFFMKKSNTDTDVAANENVTTSESIESENETDIASNQTNTSSNVVTSTTQPTITSNGTVSDDWKDCEFIFDNQVYKLDFDYSAIKNNGWSFNLADYGYSDGYVMNKGDKISSTIDLENPNFDSDVRVGFTNTSDESKDILDCQIWSVVVDNAFAKKPVTFSFAKGIHNGSTLQEVIDAYGEPTDSYRSDSLGYWNYTYQDGYNKYLKLTIYDDRGITGFSYQMFK